MNIVKLLTFVVLITAAVPLTTSSIASSGLVADHLASAQFTTRIADLTPVNNIKKATTEFNKILFYTDVRNCKGCKIVHQWWYKGNKVSVVKGKAKFKRYRWWSSKTLNDKMLGDWTVKVIIDGDFVYTKTFTYYKPTIIQQQQAPVQMRLEAQNLDGCETELRYFSAKAKEDPKDLYFEFMLKQLKKRCLGE